MRIPLRHLNCGGILWESGVDRDFPKDFEGVDGLYPVMECSKCGAIIAGDQCLSENIENILKDSSLCYMPEIQRQHPTAGEVLDAFKVAFAELYAWGVNRALSGFKPRDASPGSLVRRS